MKSIAYAVIAAAALSVSAAAMAQNVSNGPLTRAQVRAELIALENAGFNPGLDDPSYPANIQAAEARIHAKDANNGASR
jgi:hypothetical protein